MNLTESILNLGRKMHCNCNCPLNFRSNSPFGGKRMSEKSDDSDGKAKELFVEGWEFMQTLGEGAYGEVRLAVHRDTRECVAVKMVRVDDNGGEGLTHDSLKKEICIMKMLKHDHVIRFFGQRASKGLYYLFLEYADGGELFDRIEPDLGMEPGLAHHFFLQLINGVEYLHLRGVAHRDIKPENILLDGFDRLKVSDFGLSTVFRHLGKERKLNRRCGTPPYIAPEVYAGLDYNAEPADIWSCGIVLVALLAGELPWDAPTSTCAEYREWCAKNFFFSPWSKISTEPLALLKKILRLNPAKRYSIAMIKNNLWIRKSYSVIDQSSQEALTMVSPTHRPTKRVKVESSPRYSDRTGSAVTSSQPVATTEGTDEVKGHLAAVDSFTQPSRFDELIIGTQIPCTPGASQPPFQRLVLRMTRFYATESSAKVWTRLQQVVKNLGYEPRVSADEVNYVVSTVDSRKQILVFKAAIYELRPDLLLVEFRRSKGDGIEFKKIFRKIKEQCKDIICKPPPMQ